VSVVLVEPGRPIPAAADLVLLPGSKTTIPDLAFLRSGRCRASGSRRTGRAPARRGGDGPGCRRPSPARAFLRAQGWDVDILAHRRRGGRVLGLCGGYQMLGIS
jgi:adenosylcobyric acid synthase